MQYMEKFNLNTLSQELVNKIAAGEVVERPASVVKELVDNSIDSGATKIEIKVANGGIDLVEVSDNGVGIPMEFLADIFKSHTTSKISTYEDLNSVLYMGFRGEALPSILSVSNISVISKHRGSDTGGKIEFKSFDNYSIKKAPRESGTVVTVKHIFENIPVRKKYLKTPQTEYRKILEILYPYFLIYPNISFKLTKDRRVVFNLASLPDSKPHTVLLERVEEVLKEEFVKRMTKVFYSGAGMKITGLVAHPSDHQKRSVNQYMFVNGRPIWDNGVARAVVQAYERYIPLGERIPFVVNIDIKPELVDVNIHPKKEEVRFLNPFRVYSAVEEAVKKAVITITSYKTEREFSPSEYKSRSLVNKDMDKKTYSSKDITFTPKVSSSVRDSLLFSKEVLSSGGYTQLENLETESSDSIRNIFQIFNKYIVIEFVNDTLWLVDQHAAAERITFEKLSNSKGMDKQKLLIPTEITLSEKELAVLKELKEFFAGISIDYSVKKGSIEIESVPVEFIESDLKKLFDDIFSLSDEVRDIAKNISKLKDNLFATMSCHTSIRSGQSLHRDEMISLYNELIDCKNPYSCPHGRPVVWRLKLSEIDSNFERTY